MNNLFKAPSPIKFGGCHPEMTRGCKMIAFSLKIDYNIGVEVTNFIACFVALCYGSHRAPFAYTLVTSTLTAKLTGRFNFEG